MIQLPHRKKNLLKRKFASRQVFHVKTEILPEKSF